MNCTFVARSVALGLAALVCASAAGSPGVGNPTRDFARRLGFDGDSIASLERGGVIVKTLDASVGSEIAIAGAVRVGVPREYFVRQWRDIASFKRNAKVPEIGTFDNPSVLSDLDTLTVPDADVAAFRSCRIGHCGVTLPMETFGLLHHGERDGRATADRENVRVFKEMLTARVQAFRSGGPAVLTSYGGSPSNAPRSAIEAILAAVPDTLQEVPEFRAYLAEYPGPRLADVDEFSYWSKETPGPKPIISLTRVSVYTKAFDAATITFGTAMDLYSSHYLDGSIGFTIAIEAKDQRDASFYLFYVNRSRIDALNGVFGGLGRWIVKRRVRSGLQETLTLTKQRLEAGISPAFGGEMNDLDELCINTIRMLSVDVVQQANSGHPGMPMGAATMAHILWTRHLRHNPKNPGWPDRDRFVLSAGHASALLYSLLFLTGYDLAIEDLEQFRQWKSRTPGHPEHGCTPGVEVTTGPLGQGFGNSLGLAIAERWLAATFNRHGDDVVDHYTYVLASDGDIMEGVASEAASLAGTLRLGRLIVLYDANLITLSATTNVTFTEDVAARFGAYGWHVQKIDGQDAVAVDAALTAARAIEDRPSLIIGRTHIGYGSPHKQDTWHAHGEPLGVEEVRLTKRALGWPEEPHFYVPDEALREFRASIDRGAELEAAWRRRVDAYAIAHPDVAPQFAHTLAGELPEGWEAHLPTFTPADGEMATRDAGGAIINALVSVVPNLIGGSADLDPSTRTAMIGCGDFEHPPRPQSDEDLPTQGAAGGVWSFAGRNIHFGLREHAMAAALTGMALHGGLRPFGATFFSFSDYMRPSIRLAALSKAHVIYIWTHDSIALGEDGPTHQPVEQLAGLRAMPNLMMIRPSDATETVEAWRIALEHTGGPVGLVLTRQKLPVLDRSKLAPASALAQGAYILAEAGQSPPDVILIATGSEVSLALDAHGRLAAEDIRSRVVSMPCWELFEAQPQPYRDTVLPPGVRARVSIEAAAPFGWERYVGPGGAIIAVNGFGASAPGPVVMREFGFTVEHVVETAKAVLKRSKGESHGRTAR